MILFQRAASGAVVTAVLALVVGCAPAGDGPPTVIDTPVVSTPSSSPTKPAGTSGTARRTGVPSAAGETPPTAIVAPVATSCVLGGGGAAADVGEIGDESAATTLTETAAAPALC